MFTLVFHGLLLMPKRWKSRKEVRPKGGFAVYTPLATRAYKLTDFLNIISKSGYSASH